MNSIYSTIAEFINYCLETYEILSPSLTFEADVIEPEVSMQKIIEISSFSASTSYSF